VPAYVVSLLDSFDADHVAAYSSLAEKAIERYGGRYLARTRAVEAIGGTDAPQLLVVASRCVLRPCGRTAARPGPPRRLR
jgi:uncharacterized protein (DUF1330 family)